MSLFRVTNILVSRGGGESFRKSSKAGGVGGKPNKNTKLGQLLLDNKSQKIYTTRK